MKLPDRQRFDVFDVFAEAAGQPPKKPKPFAVEEVLTWLEPEGFAQATRPGERDGEVLLKAFEQFAAIVAGDAKISLKKRCRCDGRTFANVLVCPDEGDDIIKCCGHATSSTNPCARTSP